jgi:hypothetical protein
MWMAPWNGMTAVGGKAGPGARPTSASPSGMEWVGAVPDAM